jgi:hypothetical protein
MIGSMDCRLICLAALVFCSPPILNTVAQTGGDGAGGARHYREAEIVEAGSSLEVAVNSPRPLDDVLTALARKYDWRVDYEDPRYGKTDLVDDTAPSWRSEHPNGPRSYAIGGGEFDVRIPVDTGYPPQAEQVIAATVEAYNRSGNPGRFELRRFEEFGDEWFDVVPTAGTGGLLTPILDTPISFDETERFIAASTFAAFCREVTARGGEPITYLGWPFLVGQSSLSAPLQPGAALHARNRQAREVLRQMISQESATTSWRVYYDPDSWTFRLIFHSDKW